MKRTILAIATLATAGLIVRSWAAPSIEAIERAFNLKPGMSIPVVMPTGEQYRAEYRGIETRRDGEYALVFLLKK